MGKTPQVFVVTEGGGTIGFGHLTRCHSLLQAFKEVDLHPTLLVDGDQRAASFCQSQSVQLIPWHNDPARLWGIIQKADMVIVDSLLGDEAFFSRLQDDVKTPVFVDDFIRRSYRRGVVVDWTVLAESIFYAKRHPDVTYLLGSRYTALRQEFWDLKPRQVGAAIKNVLVTFGGSDVANMTPRILRLLAGALPEIEVNVVIGPGFHNADEIEKAMQPGQHAVHSPDANRMKELMLQADLAIATGGQTLYELARIGVPTIAIQVVENQRDDISGWDAAGFIHYAGTAQDAGITGKIGLLLEEVAQYRDRRERSRVGQLYIDGDGARRLIAALKEKL